MGRSGTLSSRDIDALFSDDSSEASRRRRKEKKKAKRKDKGEKRDREGVDTREKRDEKDVGKESQSAKGEPLPGPAVAPTLAPAPPHTPTPEEIKQKKLEEDLAAYEKKQKEQEALDDALDAMRAKRERAAVDDTMEAMDLAMAMRKVESPTHDEVDDDEFFPQVSRPDNGDEPTEDDWAALLSDVRQCTTRYQREAAQHLLAPDKVSAPSTSTALVTLAIDDAADAIESDVRWKLRKAEVETKADPRLKQMKYVDHSRINYEPFRKDFYLPPAEDARLSPDDIELLYTQLDGARVRGRDIPPPMRSWVGIGLNDGALGWLKRQNYEGPFAIQSLAIPVLMSGRDLLATAKTGSGKTLAYLLPAVRQAVHQRRCSAGEGPIVLILVPTHELAAQIYTVAAALCGVCKLRAAASYGGTALAANIAACKAGCEVMVATPGRLLDLLTARSAIVSLTRVTMVILDEADRMLDAAFRQHIQAFVKNIRPDRQVAVISATLPSEMRRLALGLVRDPVVIAIGGRLVPATNVEQSFHFFDEAVYDANPEKQVPDGRWGALLGILGDEAPTSLVLIFVADKVEADMLHAKLAQAGYRGIVSVLHNGLEQLDRDEALLRFTPNDRRILVATGVAERGLDVAQLELVINYSLPDHVEAYVHRIGRTGRAGRRGRAVSFFVRVRDDAIAADIADGLEVIGSLVPPELHERAMHYSSAHEGKRSRRNHARGFHRGSSYSFWTNEKRPFESDDEASPVGSDEDVRSKPTDPEINEVRDSPSQALVTVNTGALVITNDDRARVAAARNFADLSVRLHEQQSSGLQPSTMYVSEYMVNDYSAPVRSKLMKREFLNQLSEDTNTSITVKGQYFDPRLRHSHRLAQGQRKLYLEIRGESRESITQVIHTLDDAKQEAEINAAKSRSALGYHITF